MTKRIYLVIFNGKKHLVNATGQAQAASYVISTHHKFHVELAKTSDVIELITSGMKVEETSLVQNQDSQKNHL